MDIVVFGGHVKVNVNIILAEDILKNTPRIRGSEKKKRYNVISHLSYGDIGELYSRQLSIFINCTRQFDCTRTPIASLVH